MTPLGSAGGEALRGKAHVGVARRTERPGRETKQKWLFASRKPDSCGNRRRRCPAITWCRSVALSAPAEVAEDLSHAERSGFTHDGAVHRALTRLHRGGRTSFRLRDLSRRGGRVGSHQPRGTRRRRDPSRRNGCDVGSATRPWNQAVVALHALYQCRALRDVLLLHSRDSNAQGRLCNSLAHHGRILEMEGFTGQGDLWRHPGSFRPRPRDRWRGDARGGGSGVAGLAPDDLENYHVSRLLRRRRPSGRRDAPRRRIFPSTDSVASLTAARFRRSPVGGLPDEPNLPLSRQRLHRSRSARNAARTVPPSFAPLHSFLLVSPHPQPPEHPNDPGGGLPPARAANGLPPPLLSE